MLRATIVNDEASGNLQDMYLVQYMFPVLTQQRRWQVRGMAAALRTDELVIVAKIDDRQKIRLYEAET